MLGEGGGEGQSPNTWKLTKIAPRVSPSGGIEVGPWVPLRSMSYFKTLYLSRCPS